MTRRAAWVRFILLSTILTPIGPLLALPLPPPPPPPPPPLEDPWPAAGRVENSDIPELSGRSLSVQGGLQRARWLWVGPPSGEPRRLWLPLDVLQGQLGVTSRSLGPGGAIELEWFGRRLVVSAADQRPLGDEVALDVAPLLRNSGLRFSPEGDRLSLWLPPPRLISVRPSGAPSGLRRVVLDLSGPALLRREGSGLVLTLESGQPQRDDLEPLGLRGRQLAGALRISSRGGEEPVRVFSLGEPSRVVIDLPGGSTPPAAPAASVSLDPRLQARLGQQIRWDRMVRDVGGRQVRINAVRIDPRATDLELRPLSRADGMEGLSSLAGLARRQDALVAINGGFFNRIRRLPLGALRDRGSWLSGPILNRGAIGWQPGSLPRFGRLRLLEWVRDDRGERWSLTVLNSGYVQRGLSRYTAEWGPIYRSISDGESAVLVRQGRVLARYGAMELSGGIPLRAGDSLLVGRGGLVPPWQEGEALSIENRVSDPLGDAPYVVGGGPLLLLAGRPVLDGATEGFGAAFLSQGAPRTVIGSDGRQLWLITLEGIADEGPTLAESAALLRELGLRDALNLDGGSSTGLVMGGFQTVKGRGVVSAVHNGLGLVPALPTTPMQPGGLQPGS